jgi:TonB family protein
MSSSVRARIVPRAVLLFAIGVLSATAQSAADTPPPTAPVQQQPTAKFFVDSAHWLPDSRSGCLIFYRWDYDAITDVTWSGACQDNRASGSGSLTVTHDRWTEIFRGSFTNGQMDGEGSFDFADGSVHMSGEFHQGALNGIGKASWSSGMHYEGNFLNHRFRGKGKLTWPGGDTFDGYFVDWPDGGKGTLTYTDGWRFSGDFVDGVPVGDITVTKPDNTRIEGSFVPPHVVADTTPLNPSFSSTLLRPDDHARVEFRFTVGVDGAIKDIVLTVPSGVPAIDAAAKDAIAKWRMTPATVNGANVEYKPSGTFVLSHGTRAWGAGGHYDGQFVNGRFDGDGSVTWPGGDKYTGTFWNGFEHGHGRFMWANGDTYEGNFEGGSPSGQGVLLKRNGTRLEGEFVPPAIDKSVPLPDVTYPRGALRLGWQGTVAIRYRVGVDGSVKDPRILYYGGLKELDDEAISEVLRTKMIPGTLNGKPIELDAVREVRFILR